MNLPPTENLKTKLPVEGRVPVVSQFDLGHTPLRSHLLAFSIAIVVLASGAIGARAEVVSRVDHRVVAIAQDAASGFATTFGEVPSRVLSKFDGANIAMRASASRAALASASTTYTPLPIFADVDATSQQSLFVKNYRASNSAIRNNSSNRATSSVIAGDLYASAQHAYEFFTTPSRIVSTLAHKYAALGADAYATINTSLSVHRALVERSGSLVLAHATTVHDLLAATPHFVAKMNLAFIGSVGDAFERVATRAPMLAAALPGLSLGEQASLSIYETVNNFFDHVNRAVATFFVSPSNVAVAPPPTATNTSATSTSPALLPDRQAGVVTVNNYAYPTYTTAVQGVSQDYVNQSLASERNSILSIVAGMIRPVASQGVANATTIQYVSMIQKLDGLIVTNGDFRGSIFDSGIRVSATNGNFTTLTGGATTLGATTITGDLSVSGTITFPSTISALSSISAPYFTATSTTATSTFAGSLAIDTNGFVYATSTKNVGIGTTSPYAKLSVVGQTVSEYFTATSTSVRSTFPFASTTALTVSGNAYFPGSGIWNSSGFVGIGTTTPGAALAVEGSSLLGNSATAGYFTATSTTATSTFAGRLAVGTTTPFGNGLFTLGTSTPLLYVDSTTGKIGIGTSSPSQLLAVAGSGYFTGGLGIGIATTTAGVLQTSGNAYIGGNLTVIGNSTTLGGSTSDTLTINSAIKSHIIPDQNITYNLGSPSFYWNNAYVGTLTANNISAASTTIGGTQSNTFTINSDNVTSDTEDMSFIFFRGTVVPNAILSWNSAGSAKRFEFNQPLYIQNASASTTLTTLDLKSVAGQTADIFRIASSSGAYLLNFSAAGNLGIGTTTPYRTLSVAGSGVFTGGDVLASTITATSSITAASLALTTALPVTSGGTGATSFTANSLLYSNSAGTALLYAATSTLNIGGNSATVTTNANLTGAVTSTGNATVLGSFSSANLSTALTDETGSGAAVFATAPAFVGVTNSGAYTQSGTSANTFTGTPTFSNATYSALFTGGNVGIGTTTPWLALSVTNTSTSGQFVAAYDNGNYSTLAVDATGDLKITTKGGDIRAQSENLWICDNNGCPTLTATSTAGNIFVENAITFGNGFSLASTTNAAASELGLYNASGQMIVIFDNLP